VQLIHHVSTDRPVSLVLAAMQLVALVPLRHCTKHVPSVRKISDYYHHVRGDWCCYVLMYRNTTSASSVDSTDGKMQQMVTIAFVSSRSPSEMSCSCLEPFPTVTCSFRNIVSAWPTSTHFRLYNSIQLFTINMLA
jgi:hypothetical protein